MLLWLSCHQFMDCTLHSWPQLFTLYLEHPGMCQLVCIHMCANNVLLPSNSTLCNTTYLEIFDVQNF